MAEDEPQETVPNGHRMEEDTDTSLIEKSSDATELKAPMKFSFAVTKSSSSRPPLFPKAGRREEGDVEFVTEFDGKGRKPNQASTKVIPMQENSWRPEKRMKNIMMESDLTSSTEDRFETDTLSAGSQPNVQYGLQLKRKPSDPEEETLAHQSETLDDSIANDHDVEPPARDRDLQKLREDVEALPEETSMDAYENVPVEEFGEALLRGMGWEKGKPIGRNATHVVAPIEHVRRVGREGLGAIPAPQPEKVKKYIKPGETRKSKPKVGRVMCIVTGKHTGLRGQIAEVNGNTYTIALLNGGERVVVRQEELAEVGSSEEEKAISKLKELHIEKAEDGARLNRRSSLSADGGDEVEGDKLGSRTKRRDDMDDKELKRERHSSVSVLAGKETEVPSRERNDDRTGSRHRKYDDDRRGREDRSKSRREDDDHSYNANRDDDRHRSRRDGRDDKHHHEKGRGDAPDSKNERYKSRSEDKDVDRHNEKDVFEVTDSRHVRHDYGKERPEATNSRYERKDVDSRRGDNRRDALDSLSREKSKSDKREDREKNLGGKRWLKEEPAAGTVGSTRGMHSWLARDIRVRVINKNAYGGKWYLQKGCVVDVISPSVCDIQMDEGGKIVQEVKQEHLETALPKRGGRVLVVGGKHRGQVGKLQERLPEKGVGLVQMDENYEVLSFNLDDLAEFVGISYEME